jgi:hypothetical protein
MFRDVLFARKRPEVKLLDLREDTSALTTYTFTNCNTHDIGTTASITGQFTDTVVPSRSTSRKAIAVIVHGKDDALTFDVTGVTLGGVAMTQAVDRNGTTYAVDTAIFWVASASIADVANTNIAVTFSEAVTGCAIGVVSVDNLSTFVSIGTASGASAANLTLAPAPSFAARNSQHCMLVGSTHVTGSLSERVEFFVASSGVSVASGMQPPILLYEAGNAGFSYAACWSYMPGYTADTSAFAIVTSWNGAGGFDGAAVLLW